MSQAAYGRRRGISQAAVWKRTTAAGGPIPVHGPKKLIDVAEADALWEATRTVQGEAGAETAHEAPTFPSGSDLSRARAAALVVDVQTKRLALEQRRGALISRDRAVTRAFSFARMLRDAWLNWPTRIGPPLAADLGVEPAVLVLALEELVRAPPRTGERALRVLNEGYRRSGYATVRPRGERAKPDECSRAAPVEETPSSGDHGNCGR